MAAYEDPQIFEVSVTADQRRDKPYYENTTGTVISGGATGVLEWASNFDRRAWGRKDADGDLYYELEVTDVGEITVRHADELGDDTETVVTGLSPSTTYSTLVDGVSVPLHSSLTIGHIARVYPGSFMTNSGGAFYTPVGEESAWKKYAVPNTGASVSWKLCQIVVARGYWHENTSGSAIARIESNVVNPTADAYAVTISNGTNPGTKKFTFTGTYNTYVEDNIAAASTDNAIGASGLVFDAGAAPANTDTAVVYVDDQADVVEICPDDGAGSPDELNIYTWNPSTGVVMPISPAGATDQVCPAGQTMYFWGRVNPGGSFTIGRGLSYWKCDVQRAA